MEYLVTMTTHVPDGASDAAVADIRGPRGGAVPRTGGEGHLLRLWRPPLQPGEWRTLGLFAAGRAELEEVLASMPLRVWRTDEVTALSPHPNDPGTPEPRASPGGSEFLTTFIITIPADTPGAAADATEGERPIARRSWRRKESCNDCGRCRARGGRAGPVAGRRRRARWRRYWIPAPGRMDGRGDHAAPTPATPIGFPLTGMHDRTEGRHRHRWLPGHRRRHRRRIPRQGVGGGGHVTDDQAVRGPDMLAVAGDISDPATGDRIVDDALDRFGRIDTLYQQRRRLRLQALHRLHGRGLRRGGRGQSHRVLSG